MYKYLLRNGVLVGSLLALLAIIIAVIPIIGGLGDFDMLPDDTRVRAVAEEGDIFYTGIYVTYVLLGMAVLAVIFLGIWGIFKDMKSSMKGVIGFVLVLVFFGILYAMAGTDAVGSLKETVENPEFGITDTIFKLVSGSINGTIFLLVAAFLTIVAMEIWNFFKTA